MPKRLIFHVQVLPAVALAVILSPFSFAQQTAPEQPTPAQQPREF